MNLAQVIVEVEVETEVTVEIEGEKEGFFILFLYCINCL
jgi:hypothetical protein